MIEKKSRLLETKNILKLILGLFISILLTSILVAILLSNYEKMDGVITYLILVILASFHSFLIPLTIYFIYIVLIYQVIRIRRFKFLYVFLLSITYPLIILILDLNFFSKCNEIISYLKFCQFPFLFSIVSVIVVNLFLRGSGGDLKGKINAVLQTIVFEKDKN